MVRSLTSINAGTATIIVLLVATAPEMRRSGVGTMGGSTGGNADKIKPADV